MITSRIEYSPKYLNHMDIWIKMYGKPHSRQRLFYVYIYDKTKSMKKELKNIFHI